MGQMVFKTTQEKKGWDGFYNNTKADAGVYFWHIEGKDKFGNKMTRKGDVSLFR